MGRGRGVGWVVGWGGVVERGRWWVGGFWRGRRRWVVGWFEGRRGWEVGLWNWWVLLVVVVMHGFKRRW